jgi:hypothetical protein
MPPDYGPPSSLLPGPKHCAGIWRVGALDSRIEAEPWSLDSQRVAPAKEKFCPAIDSLSWREQHLTTEY